MPLKIHDLIDTLSMLEEAQNRRRRKLRNQVKKRGSEDQAIIEEAKRILMERNNMTEAEAHRYIQKTSMDSATNMVETAQMVIHIMKQ